MVSSSKELCLAPPSPRHTDAPPSPITARRAISTQASHRDVPRGDIAATGGPAVMDSPSMDLDLSAPPPSHTNAPPTPIPAQASHPNGPHGVTAAMGGPAVMGPPSMGLGLVIPTHHTNAPATPIPARRAIAAQASHTDGPRGDAFATGAPAGMVPPLNELHDGPPSPDDFYDPLPPLHRRRPISGLTSYTDGPGCYSDAMGAPSVMGPSSMELRKAPTSPDDLYAPLPPLRSRRAITVQAEHIDYLRGKKRGATCDPDVMGSPRKKLRLAPPAERRATSLPVLLGDVLAKVFSYLNPKEVLNARLVCTAWKKSANENHHIMWNARCDALGLLTARPGTVLGVCVQRLLAKVAPIKARLQHETLTHKESARLLARQADIYRKHYYKWRVHICKSCTPRDLKELRPCCTPPNTFEWMKQKHPQRYRLIVDNVGTFRTIRCPRPPRDELGPEWTGHLYRTEDFLRALNVRNPKWYGENMIRDFRENGVVIS